MERSHSSSSLNSDYEWWGEGNINQYLLPNLLQKNDDVFVSILVERDLDFLTCFCTVDLPKVEMKKLLQGIANLFYSHGSVTPLIKWSFEHHFKAELGLDDGEGLEESESLKETILREDTALTSIIFSLLNAPPARQYLEGILFPEIPEIVKHQEKEPKEQAYYEEKADAIFEKILSLPLSPMVCTVLNTLKNVVSEEVIRSIFFLRFVSPAIIMGNVRGFFTDKIFSSPQSQATLVRICKRLQKIGNPVQPGEEPTAKETELRERFSNFLTKALESTPENEYLQHITEEEKKTSTLQLRTLLKQHRSKIDKQIPLDSKLFLKYYKTDLLQMMKDTDWKLVKKGKENLYRRHSQFANKNSNYVFRAETELPANIQKIYEFLIDNDNIGKYTKGHGTLEVLKTWGTRSLVHHTLHMGAFMKDRDLLYIRNWEFFQNEKVAIIYGHSVESISVQSPKGMIRMDVLVSGTILEEIDENNTRVTTIQQFDIHARVPKFVQKSFGTGAVEFLENLRNLMTQAS